MPPTLQLVLLLVAVLLPSPAGGSRGDRLEGFRRCEAACRGVGPPHCASAYGRPAVGCVGASASLLHRLAGAGQGAADPAAVERECALLCASAVAAYLKETGRPAEKFHGRWAFRRSGGLAEPLSAAFSVLNASAHLEGWLAFRRAYNAAPEAAAKAYPWAPLWALYALLNLLMWAGSTAWHSAATDATEKADYAGVTLAAMGSLLVALARAADLRTPRRWAWLAAALGPVYAGHAAYLLLPSSIDYGWNLKFHVGTSVLNSAVWLAWAFRRRHPARHVLLRFVALIYAALALEVLDFPPVAGLLDAHACWHAVTVPLISGTAASFWTFVLGDLRYALAAGDETKAKVA